MIVIVVLVVCSNQNLVELFVSGNKILPKVKMFKSIQFRDANNAPYTIYYDSANIEKQLQFRSRNEKVQ